MSLLLLEPDPTRPGAGSAQGYAGTDAADDMELVDTTETRTDAPTDTQPPTLTVSVLPTPA